MTCGNCERPVCIACGGRKGWDAPGGWVECKTCAGAGVHWTDADRVSAYIVQHGKQVTLRQIADDLDMSVARVAEALDDLR